MLTPLTWGLWGELFDQHSLVKLLALFRYPLIIEDCMEEWAEMVDGVEVPVDYSQPNPNGMEFDNLYLVRPDPMRHALPSLSNAKERQ